MEFLQHQLQWDDERLVTFVTERNLNSLTLTKREASDLIDELKVILGVTPAQPGHTDPRPFDEERSESNQQPQLPIGERATHRQIRALERLAEERGIDWQAELKQRFRVASLDLLSLDAAGQLLSEWQQRPRQDRR